MKDKMNASAMPVCQSTLPHMFLYSDGSMMTLASKTWRDELAGEYFV
jgi:hypothetical protein